MTSNDDFNLNSTYSDSDSSDFGIMAALSANQFRAMLDTITPKGEWGDQDADLVKQKLQPYYGQPGIPFIPSYLLLEQHKESFVNSLNFLNTIYGTGVDGALNEEFNLNIEDYMRRMSELSERL